MESSKREEISIFGYKQIHRFSAALTDEESKLGDNKPGFKIIFIKENEETYQEIFFTITLKDYRMWIEGFKDFFDKKLKKEKNVWLYTDNKKAIVKNATNKKYLEDFLKTYCKTFSNLGQNKVPNKSKSKAKSKSNNKDNNQNLGYNEDFQKRLSILSNLNKGVVDKAKIPIQDNSKLKVNENENQKLSDNKNLVKDETYRKKIVSKFFQQPEEENNSNPKETENSNVSNISKISAMSKISKVSKVSKVSGISGISRKSLMSSNTKYNNNKSNEPKDKKNAIILKGSKIYFNLLCANLNAEFKQKKSEEKSVLSYNVMTEYKKNLLYYYIPAFLELKPRSKSFDSIGKETLKSILFEKFLNVKVQYIFPIKRKNIFKNYEKIHSFIKGLNFTESYIQKKFVTNLVSSLKLLSDKIQSNCNNRSFISRLKETKFSKSQISKLESDIWGNNEIVNVNKNSNMVKTISKSKLLQEKKNKVEYLKNVMLKDKESNINIINEAIKSIEQGNNNSNNSSNLFHPNNNIENDKLLNLASSKVNLMDNDSYFLYHKKNLDKSQNLMNIKMNSVDDNKEESTDIKIIDMGKSFEINFLINDRNLYGDDTNYNNKKLNLLLNYQNKINLKFNNEKSENGKSLKKENSKYQEKENNLNNNEKEFEESNLISLSNLHQKGKFNIDNSILSYQSNLNNNNIDNTKIEKSERVNVVIEDKKPEKNAKNVLYSMLYADKFKNNSNQYNNNIFENKNEIEDLFKDLLKDKKQTNKINVNNLNTNEFLNKKEIKKSESIKSNAESKTMKDFIERDFNREIESMDNKSSSINKLKISSNRNFFNGKNNENKNNDYTQNKSNVFHNNNTTKLIKDYKREFIKDYIEEIKSNKIQDNLFSKREFSKKTNDKYDSNRILDTSLTLSLGSDFEMENVNKQKAEVTSKLIVGISSLRNFSDSNLISNLDKKSKNYGNKEIKDLKFGVNEEINNKNDLFNKKQNIEILNFIDNESDIISEIKSKKTGKDNLKNNSKLNENITLNYNINNNMDSKKLNIEVNRHISGYHKKAEIDYSENDFLYSNMIIFKQKYDKFYI